MGRKASARPCCCYVRQRVLRETRDRFRQAKACNRIEGIPHDPATDPIFEALILGEIDFEEAIARIKALPSRA
jgi:hypothetical protein